MSSGRSHWSFNVSFDMLLGQGWEVGIIPSRFGPRHWFHVADVRLLFVMGKMYIIYTKNLNLFIYLFSVFVVLASIVENAFVAHVIGHD